MGIGERIFHITFVNIEVNTLLEGLKGTLDRLILPNDGTHELQAIPQEEHCPPDSKQPD